MCRSCPYHRPGDPAVAELIAARIAEFAARGTPIRAVMLERLGPNVWHRTPAEAMAVLEELEETAKLWLLAQPRPVPLAEAQNRVVAPDLRRALVSGATMPGWLSRLASAPALVPLHGRTFRMLWLALGWPPT